MAVGVRTDSSLSGRQSFLGDSGGSVVALRIPVGFYEKGTRPFIDNLQPLATQTLWDSSQDIGIADEFDLALFCNYGLTDLHLSVYIAGGQPEQLVVPFRVRAGLDQPIDGQWYGADNAGEVGTPTFHTPILTRVTKISVWNPSDTDEGSCELYMFAEEE